MGLALIIISKSGTLNSGSIPDGVFSNSVTIELLGFNLFRISMWPSMLCTSMWWRFKLINLINKNKLLNPLDYFYFQKSRKWKTFSTHVAIKARWHGWFNGLLFGALLGIKIEWRIIDARVNVVDVARKMNLFRESFVAQLAFWALLARFLMSVLVLAGWGGFLRLLISF